MTPEVADWGPEPPLGDAAPVTARVQKAEMRAVTRALFPETAEQGSSGSQPSTWPPSLPLTFFTESSHRLSTGPLVSK